MNKRAIVQKIIASLTAELELYAQSARAAHAEATHEQSKAENKYDTRGLEASYLAHGQSRQMAETDLARQQFEALAVRDFQPGEPIDIGALIELETSTESAGGSGLRSLYFIGPKAGGTEVVHSKRTVLVITPESPLGRQLKGKKLGDRLSIEMGGVRNDYRVVTVW